KVATGYESGDEGRLAEAAIPIRYKKRVGQVAAFSVPLSGVEQNLALLRRRILAAGAIALSAALVAGYWVARALSRRVKGLEGAAGRRAPRRVGTRHHG